MTAIARQQQAPALPRIFIADGTIEALKWLAVAMMTVDHINKYLLDWSVPWMSAVGRMTMPIFALALAYNLARPGTLAQGAYGRTLRRLGLVGALATVPFMGLGKLVALGWWPLNILFTLWLATAVMCLLDRGTQRHRAAAATVFIAGGALPEFWWPAIALAVAAHSYFRAPSTVAAVCFVGATAALVALNGNYWALGGLVVFLGATRVNLRVPRLRWVFYAFYPLHLAVLWVAQRMPGARPSAASDQINGVGGDRGPSTMLAWFEP